MSEDC